MNPKKFLIIDFFQQNDEHSRKEPVKIALTNLENNNYALTHFFEYSLLHYILTDWIKIHNTFEPDDVIQNRYELFLSNKKKFLECDYDSFKRINTDFDCADDLSNIFINSINTTKSKLYEEGKDNSIQSQPQQLLCKDDSINEKKSGLNKVTQSDGASYEGYFMDGVFQGFGCYIWPGGDRYVGEFKNNEIHGKGFLVWPDGKKYYGDWVCNEMEGNGELRYPDGRVYVGQYKKDLREGYGQFNWPNGKVFKGYWKNGRQHGDGVIIDTKQDKELRGTWCYGKRVQK